MQKKVNYFKWILTNPYYYLFLIISSIGLSVITKDLMKNSVLGIVGNIILMVSSFQFITLLIFFLVYKHIKNSVGYLKERIKGLNRAILTITIYQLIGFLIYLNSFNILGIIFEIITVIFWIVMIFSVGKENFKNKKNKSLWVLIVVFTSVFGAILYYFVVRKFNKN